VITDYHTKLFVHELSRRHWGGATMTTGFVVK